MDGRRRTGSKQWYFAPQAPISTTIGSTHRVPFDDPVGGERDPDDRRDGRLAGIPRHDSCAGGDPALRLRPPGLFRQARVVPDDAVSQLPAGGRRGPRGRGFRDVRVSDLRAGPRRRRGRWWRDCRGGDRPSRGSPGDGCARITGHRQCNRWASSGRSGSPPTLDSTPRRSSTRKSVRSSRVCKRRSARTSCASTLRTRCRRRSGRMPFWPGWCGCSVEGTPENLDELSLDIAREIEATWVEVERSDGQSPPP